MRMRLWLGLGIISMSRTSMMMMMAVAMMMMITTILMLVGMKIATRDDCDGDIGYLGRCSSFEYAKQNRWWVCGPSCLRSRVWIQIGDCNSFVCFHALMRSRKRVLKRCCL